jgi:hypothetical protein
MTAPRLVLILCCVARQHIERARAKQLAGEPAMIVGSGRFKYRVNADWAKLPNGWSLQKFETVE